MTFRTSAPHARPRWLALATAIAMISLLFVTAATATIAPSTFEGNDGNQNVDTTGNTDWANVAGKHTGTDVSSRTADNAFGQGTSEDDPNVSTVTGSIPPNKNNLTSFLEASEVVGGDVYLYLGWSRAVNIGNANLDFEINQASTDNLGVAGKHLIARTAGDLLVTYDFGGSGTPALGLLTWITSGASSDCFSAHGLPCWGNRVNLDGAVSEGAVSSDGLFGEAAINLTDAGVFPAGQCESFGSTFVKSRSSSSFTAELKDFIAPVEVRIANCGEVIINKTTVPAGSTHSFGFTTTNSLASAFNLTGETGANRTKDITDVQAGSYSVSEGSTTGWTLTGISCTATGTGTSVTGTTLPTASFTVAAGGLVTCTFTNALDKNSPGATSAPALIPQDSVTVSGLDTTGAVSGSSDKVMTVSLYGATDTSCSGSPMYTKTFTVTANQAYVTDNSGTGASPSAYKITADGTYKWKVHYNGDSRNNPFDVACGVEQVVVDITP